jgi:hypothetical protein
VYDAESEERCLVVITRESSKAMQTVMVLYCISPGELMGDEITLTSELSTAALRRYEEVGKSQLHRIKVTAVKQHCCFYCKNFYVEMSKHLIRSHCNEAAVCAIKKMGINSKERNAALKALRLKGDYNHNKNSTLENIITYRKLSKNSVKDTVVCVHCSALLSHKNFARHERKCSGRPPNYEGVTDEARDLLEFENILQDRSLDETPIVPTTESSFSLENQGEDNSTLGKKNKGIGNFNNL